jgi:hypothetical protein
MPCAVAVSSLVHGVTWMLPNPDRRLLQRFHIDIQLASNLHSLLMNLSDKLRHQCFHRFFVLKWNVVVTLIACTYFNRDAILVESLDKVGTVTATTTSMNELMPLVKLAKARNEGRTTRLLLSQKVMMTAPRRRAPVPSLLHWCIFLCSTVKFYLVANNRKFLTQSIFHLVPHRSWPCFVPISRVTYKSPDL